MTPSRRMLLAAARDGMLSHCAGHDWHSRPSGMRRADHALAPLHAAGYIQRVPTGAGFSRLALTGAGWAALHDLTHETAPGDVQRRAGAPTRTETGS